MTSLESAADRLPAPADLDLLLANARRASALLKAVSHESRLLLLCLLSAGERSVGELEAMLGLRQAAVSQQLARLRSDGLVACRRDGKAVIYRIADEDVRRIVGVVHEIFCGGGGEIPAAPRF